MIPMRDGTQLATDVYRPALDGELADETNPIDKIVHQLNITSSGTVHSLYHGTSWAVYFCIAVQPLNKYSQKRTYTGIYSDYSPLKCDSR